MAARQTNLTIMIGALAGLLVLVGVQVATDGDDGGGATSPADSVAVIPDSSDVPVDSSVDSGVDPGVGSTVAPTVAPSGSLSLLSFSALPMPTQSQFAGTQFAFDRAVDGNGNPAVDIARMTGMIWNTAVGAYYAIDQDGGVHKVDESLSTDEVVLDLSSEVTDYEPGAEKGMLGIAFNPLDGRMFLHFNDNNFDSNIVSFAMAGDRPDPATRRLVLFQKQPGPGHNAGQLQFTANGDLYIALGDGGGSQGRDAQDYSKMLGAILRIRPKLDAEGYDVPADNPYVNQAGVAPEIWVKGLRNPWRFNLDEATGDMYIGDVGENTWEELDIVPKGTSGQNFGWYYIEGNEDRGEGTPSGVTFTPPVYAYDHANTGPAIIGGFIYYGNLFPQLRGAYVFADMTGVFFALGSDGATKLQYEGGLGVVTSFVQTPEGELLIVTQRAGIRRLVPA